ncbi:MAG: hypothetical protein SFX72_17005 [Isosphaeraceae bacterium]|nr:hypothetical protein [Isosphaeraceae bacterium]
MNRGVAFALPLGCLLAAALVCLSPVILRGEVAAYRDAGHYYHPLHERIDILARAGHSPYWDPTENGGRPLGADPTAALFYPVRLITRGLSFGFVERIDILGHLALAAFSAYRLARALGTGHLSACAGASIYALSGPILFQTCNIIFLRGAAWLPLAWEGAHVWVSERRIRGAILLAVASAMQVLGGDPQGAYLAILTALGWCLTLPISGRSESREARGRRLGRMAAFWIISGAASLGFAAIVYARKIGDPPRSVTLAIGGLIGIALSIKTFRKIDRARRVSIIGIAAAALLAVGLASVQIIPSVAFAWSTPRALFSQTLEIFSFSLPPYRLVEVLWPNVFGTTVAGNHSWAPAILADRQTSARVWVDSLYLGGFAIPLAAAVSASSRDALARFLAIVALVSGLLALGEFASPLLWARQIPALARYLGPPDLIGIAGPRADGALRDGFLSPYGIAAACIPGFGTFRYPAKLLTPCVLAVAMLAALGVERWLKRDSCADRILKLCACCMIVLSCLGLVASEASARWFRSAMENAVDPSFGPVDAAGASADLGGGLIHGGLVGFVLLGLTMIPHDARRLRFGVAALVCMIPLELAAANRRLVITVPASDFVTPPEALTAIRDDLERAPFAGPFRVHRAVHWEPAHWRASSSSDRMREHLAWERATLMPKHGSPFEVETTFVPGPAVVVDWSARFEPYVEEILDRSGSRGNAKTREVVIQPRKLYDLWNTRYFILPHRPGVDRSRGFGSFLENTVRIFPPEEAFVGPSGAEAERAWASRVDYQIRRNLTAFPRAWVVHDGRPQSARLSRRSGPSSGIPAGIDPARTAWLRAEDLAIVGEFLDGGPTNPLERPRVDDRDPSRIVIDVVLSRPGLLILADRFDPDWKVEVAGRPAPLLEVNDGMRGVALPGGPARVVFVYRPHAIGLGWGISGVASIGLVGFLVLRSIRGFEAIATDR